MRKVAIPDFYSAGEHVYEDELGWRDDDTFYGIHSEEIPIVVKKLPRDSGMKFIGWQCKGDTHLEGEIIGVFDDAEKIWNEQLFGGKHLEDVLRRSYIVGLN